MGTPPGLLLQKLLQKKVDFLRQGTDYRLLLETAASVGQSTSGLPEDVLASIADVILRPIARDISSLVPGSKVMLHIYVSGE